MKQSVLTISRAPAFQSVECIACKKELVTGEEGELHG